jgi:hypothetical protein
LTIHVNNLNLLIFPTGLTHLFRQMSLRIAARNSLRNTKTPKRQTNEQHATNKRFCAIGA